MLKSASAPCISFDTAPRSERAPRASSLFHPNDPSTPFHFHNFLPTSVLSPTRRPRASQDHSPVSKLSFNAAAPPATFRRKVDFQGSAVAFRRRLDPAFAETCVLGWPLLHSTVCTPFWLIFAKISRAALSFAGSRGILSIPGGGSLMIPQKSPSCLMVATKSKKSTGLTT